MTTAAIPATEGVATPMPAEPTIKVTEVTPELAEHWLGKNEGNRNIRYRQVDAYARDMRGGRWQFNGDSIRIADDGTLMDGQHRLLAIVKTGCTIPMVVITGLSREAQNTMDAGAKRTASDQLKRRGIPNANWVAAVALKMIQWDKYGQRRSFHNVNVTNAEVVDYCADQYFLDTLSLGSGYRKTVKAPPAVVGFCFCLFARLDFDAAVEFFDGLSSGAGLLAGSPVLALRERLADLRSGRDVSISSERYIALFCRAWNYYRDGKSIGILKAPHDKEAYPEPR